MSNGWWVVNLPLAEETVQRMVQPWTVRASGGQACGARVPEEGAHCRGKGGGVVVCLFWGWQRPQNNLT